MKLNDLRPGEGSKFPRKRLGRGIGSGLGKTGGRGHKGQKARTGKGIMPGFEGGQMPIQRRLPKFGFKTEVSRMTAEIRSSELNALEGNEVDLAVLKNSGLVRKDMQRAKIVLSGEVTKSFVVRGVAVTAGAKASIEKAGGKVEGE